MISYFSKQTFVTVILTVAFLMFSLFIYGLFGNVNITIGPFTQRTFTVQGEGKVSVVPDTYTSTFSVQEKGTTQEEAQQAGNTKQNEALAALEALGFKENDVKTTQYSLNPNYDFSQGTRRESGYLFTQSTTFKTKDRSKMEQALDKLGSIGINIGGINTEVDNEKFMQQARKEAVKDARSKAEDIAQTAGFKLGGIASISEFGTAGPVMPIALRDTAANVGAPEEKSVISPGENEVSTTVSVTYFIK